VSTSKGLPKSVSERAEPLHSAPLNCLRAALVRPSGFAFIFLSAALLWSYWPVIWPLIKDLRGDDNYSVCLLVPLIAAYLLWRERMAIGRLPVRACWWGLGLVLLAQAVRLYGLLFLYESLERYSLVLTICGLTLLLAGWRIFWRLKWILAFLFLMVPLPGRVHNAISGPLQTQATSGAVFCLEVFGVDVVREGNVILLDDSIGVSVAEACSGLRMLSAFVVVAATFAYLLPRPAWQKFVLVVSSVPVAIACNIFRLCVTAMLYLVVSGAVAERFFHDFAGIAMMPAAVFILIGEVWVMDKLTVRDTQPVEPQSRRTLRKRPRRSRAGR